MSSTQLCSFFCTPRFLLQGGVPLPFSFSSSVMLHRSSMASSDENQDVFFRHMQGAHSLLLELSWLLLLVLLPHAYWQMFVLPKTNPLKEWLVRTPEWRRQLKIFILERSREDSRKSQGPL